jgi:hypothetical protein
MDLWAACGAGTAPVTIAGTLFRMVESQEQVATMNLVDELDEQDVLEQLLDTVKPPYRSGTAGLHYLLKTPFRYPPLRHGSRFGRRHEPGIFYGSLSRDTALAESAYYRLLFWYGQTVAPAQPYTTQHTLFEAAYASEQGLQLQRPGCAAHRAVLTDPGDYRATQVLGSAMRDAGIEAFEAPSARCPQQGVNIGLFQPSALACVRPTASEGWLCRTQGDQVVFSSRAVARALSFPTQGFAMNGGLPQAAI